ncbi:MAG: hypothetical protein SGI92_23260 [Bryobacteraceae bacterium]|nr:hypothetical protein [Bryobacteraceae bacterium]
MKSLVPIVDRLKNRFGIGSVCIVADRGMISAETLAEVELRKWQYILGVRMRSSKLIASQSIDFTVGTSASGDGVTQSISAFTLTVDKTKVTPGTTISGSVTLPVAATEDTKVHFYMSPAGPVSIGFADYFALRQYAGFHSSVKSGIAGGFTYAVVSLDTADDNPNLNIGTLAHEIFEWAFDPFAPDVNWTPAWGNVGQVKGCQTNLEVGDPLSRGPFTTVSSAAGNFTIQDNAFPEWFYGVASSSGVNGWFSMYGQLPYARDALQIDA